MKSCFIHFFAKLQFPFFAEVYFRTHIKDIFELPFGFFFMNAALIISMNKSNTISFLSESQSKK